MAFHLETPRLILRAFEDQDVEEFARYRSDPEVARYQSWDTPYSTHQAARMVNALKAQSPGLPGEWYQVAVTLKSNHRLIGDCGFSVLANDTHQAEIGFTLARAYQKQGYGSEAVRALLDYLFHSLQLHRVRANCDPDNTASARLLERVGMRHEGHFVESLWLKGRWCSEDWFAVLQREWQNGGGKPASQD